MIGIGMVAMLCGDIKAKANNSGEKFIMRHSYKIKDISIEQNDLLASASLSFFCCLYSCKEKGVVEYEQHLKNYENYNTHAFHCEQLLKDPIAVKKILIYAETSDDLKIETNDMELDAKTIKSLAKDILTLFV